MFGEIMKKQESDKQIAMRISTVSITVNLLLAFGKFFAGVIGNSGAMISDAIHSASDVFSTIIVMIGVSISSRESDKDHPYGHERLECVASIILAVILFATGVGIGMDGIVKIVNGEAEEIAIPTLLPLIVAVLSILVKEWMYWYTRAGAKKINSGAMMADAWHHRSDSLSSVGAFVGILLARLGFPLGDAAASVVICIFIGKAAYDIFKDAMDKMVDKSCDDETIQKIKELALSTEGVERVDQIQTRLFGSKIYVDIEIAVNGNESLYRSHGMAEEVHDKIEEMLPTAKHCMVHVNPL